MTRFRRSLSMLLALAILLSMVCVLPGGVSAATADTYISASYAANLSVKTTKVANLMQYPTTTSTTKYTLPADTMLTVKALHKNTAGTYWYEVLFYDMTLYIDATTTTLVDHLTGDVSIANLCSPASLAYGRSFAISGDISSTLNDLGTITAAMYTGSNITKAPSYIVTDNAGSKSYSLSARAIDSGLTFGSMAAGVYTYVITADAVSYYVDASGALATSTQTVVLETQQCVITDWTNPNDDLAFGIDVSVWQGSIDWSQTKNDIDFAVLRIGFSETLDNRFLEYAEGCETYDIPYGVYHFSYALTVAEAIAEAEFVINALDTYGYDPELPIWYDMEWEDQGALSTALKEQILVAFCDTIAEAGYQPGFYGFTSWFSSSFARGYLSSLPQWIAQIDGFSSNGTATYDGGTWLWQYSWEGSISGISTDVDCNLCYAEIPGFSSDTSYLAQCTYYPAHSNAHTNASVNLRQYPNSGYTTYGLIDANTQVEITGLYKNAAGEYWYQVNVGSQSGYMYADYVTVDSFLYDDVAAISPTMSDNLAVGSGYYLKGNLVSRYNTINTTWAKVYSGEDTLASPVLSGSYANDSKAYKLSGSAVCSNMVFSKLSAGYYTYEISADVKNYYISGGTLTNQTENVVLWTAPFTVGSAAITPPSQMVCDHDEVADAAVAPTCTTSGLTAGSHCSKCGMIYTAQTEIPATGHSYAVTSDSANCTYYEVFHYNCTSCGDSFDISADELANWSETKPQGVSDSLIESKTQYRYADCTSQTWVESGNGTVQYVNSWPSGFSTGSSAYSTYNKKSSKVTASETATDKTVVNSDAVVGYLYYHWCYSGSYYSVESKSGSYTTFHAFYSTGDPSSCTNYDATDGSYYNPNSSCCSNSDWYWYATVYEQSYTTYTKEYDGKTWGAWSEWSDTAYTAVENTRKVETRTVYRYTAAALGDHVWENGTCSACGTTCSHSGYTTTCGVCGKALVTPKITPTVPTLNFESEVHYNIYFTTSGLDDVALTDMGLLTWNSPQTGGTYDTAQGVIPGAISANNMLMVHSNGIPAKNLADTMYFKIYARLSDGTYVYSDMYGYSAKAYADDRLANSSNAQLKSLCVAMLNYGAAAQVQFNYRPYSLMNSELTAEQKALVADYNSDMVAPVTAADKSKVGAFTATGGFSALSPAVAFEGAFSINYYFTPSNAMDSDLTFYYWTPEDYQNATVLTTNNAGGSIVMTESSVAGRYTCTYEGIAAKEVDQTVYVAGIYKSGGKVYCTGVIAYSLGAYCKDRIQYSSDANMVALAKATATYGYYAKEYFANL